MSNATLLTSHYNKYELIVKLEDKTEVRIACCEKVYSCRHKQLSPGIGVKTHF